MFGQICDSVGFVVQVRDLIDSGFSVYEKSLLPGKESDTVNSQN